MISEVAPSVFSEELYKIEKKTFVIIGEPWELITESERALLEKILQAVGLSIDAVAILYQPTLAMNYLRQHAARVIYFNGDSNELPLNEVIVVQDIPVIHSLPLKQLQTDAASKQKFWSGLKVLFSR